MDWVQVLTIIFSTFGFAYWCKQSSDRNADRIDSDLKNIATRLEFDSRLQCQRTDKLYEMFYDLIKETRKHEM